MKFSKPNILNLTLCAVILGLLMYPAENAFSQNSEADDELTYGNVLLMNENHLKNGNVMQNGILNTLFVWPHRDSLQNYVSTFEGSQSGILNQAIIFSRLNAVPLNVIIDQQGVRNRLTILQGAGNQYTSKDDSTATKKNSVTIRQKGNNNKATIIQN